MYNWQKNPHGMWRHCQVCNLRLAYVPRQGSPSSSTQAMNHAMVQRMLHELEPMMKGRMPTARICKAMMDKVTADLTVEKLASAALQSPENVKISTPRAKSSAAPADGYTATSSPSSWEMAEEKDMENLLTEEEKNQLGALLRDRRMAHQIPVEENMASAFEGEMVAEQ